jgi:hypothetical protein
MKIEKLTVPFAYYCEDCGRLTLEARTVCQAIVSNVKNIGIDNDGHYYFYEDTVVVDNYEEVFIEFECQHCNAAMFCIMVDKTVFNQVQKRDVNYIYIDDITTYSNYDAYKNLTGNEKILTAGDLLKYIGEE